MQTYKKSKNTLVPSLFALLLLGLMAFMALFYEVEIGNLNKQEQDYFQRIVYAYQQNLIENLQNDYSKKLNSFIDDDIKQAIAQQDRQKLKQLTLSLFNKMQQQDTYLKVLQYHLPNGRSFLRLHQPDVFGDNIAQTRPALAHLHQHQERLTAFETGVFHTFVYRIIEPLFFEDQYIGAVEIAVSAQKLLDIIDHNNQLEGAISSFDAPDPIAVNNIQDPDLLAFYQEQLLKKNTIPDHVKLKDKTYRFYQFPINDFLGHPMGEFTFIQDVSPYYAQLHNSLSQMAVLSLILFALIFVLLGRLIKKHEAAIYSINQRNRNIINAQSDIVLVTNGHEIIDVNQKFLTLLDFPNLEAFKQHHTCVCEMFIAAEGFITTITDNQVWIDYLLKHSDKDNLAQLKIQGNLLIFRLFALQLNEQEVVVTMQNISELYFKERELAIQLSLLNENLLISSTDLQGEIISASQAFLRFTGYTLDELLGKTHRIMRHPDTSLAVYDDLWQTITQNKVWHGELKNVKKNGETFWGQVFIHPKLDRDGTKIGYTAIRQDITDKKRIEILSITDALTQLYNRRYFDEVLPSFLQSTPRGEEHIGFMMIDIDHFKGYNDTYGHQMGDKALQQVAKLLNSSMKRSDDYCFRIGGEEFAILMHVDASEKALAFAQHLCQQVEALQIEHHKNTASPYVTISAGLLTLPASLINDPDDLYRMADDCLYQAKNAGRNRVVAHNRIE